MKHPFYIIVAIDENGGIGKAGTLPWRFKKEFAYFRKVTTGTTDKEKQNMLIMGRKTWESISENFRPLKGRKNIVLTSVNDYIAEGAIVSPSLDAALQLADDKIEKTFILGGGQVFNEAISHPDLTGIYLTKVHAQYDCDTFFPKISESFSNVKKIGSDEEEGTKFEYLLLSK